MLQKLLERIAQGGVHSTTALARELGVSQGLLEQMIEDLVRMGYLRAVGESCAEHCAGCSLRESCALGGPGGIWALTEKGEKATRER